MRKLLLIMFVAIFAVSCDTMLFGDYGSKTDFKVGDCIASYKNTYSEFFDVKVQFYHLIKKVGNNNYLYDFHGIPYRAHVKNYEDGKWYLNKVGKLVNKKHCKNMEEKHD